MTNGSGSQPPFKFASPFEAYKSARRRILNNALRRGQISLDLSLFGLTELPPEIGKLKGLRTLNLSNNQLSTLPREIGQMEGLSVLEVKANKLTSLPDTFNGLRNLMTLSLQRNKLRDIPSALYNLTSLRSLDLSDNSIQRIASEIGSLASLESFDIERNEIETLPSELGKLRRLQWLSLQGNKLTEAQPIAALTNLVMVDLDDNKLSSLPHDFNALTKLGQIYLSKNQFSEFPAVLFELPKLEIIAINGNRLRGVPGDIGKLINLSQIRARSNEITSLPPDIGKLSKLENLSLEGNLLTEIPREVGHITALERAAREASNRKQPSKGLQIEHNPLPEPYPLLLAQGQPHSTINVLRWLRSELDPKDLSQPEDATNDSDTVPDEPSQEAGPTFQIADSGKLDLAPGHESTDFDRAVQETLHRALRRRTEYLREATARVGNQHPQLSTVVEEYANLVNQAIADLDVVDLWAAGNALMAQAASFQEQDPSRTITEPLEPSHLGLLMEVAALHGGFILGFPKAMELSNRADQARFDAEVINSILGPTSNILSTLARQRRFLTERATRLIEALDATLVAGSWHTARIGYTSYATVRNALVAIGRVILWMNDKGGSVAGGVIVGGLLEATHVSAETLNAILAFLHNGSSDVLSFAAPFPELRTYLQWIITHFDTVEAGPKDKKSASDLLK